LKKEVFKLGAIHPAGEAFRPLNPLFVMHTTWSNWCRGSRCLQMGRYHRRWHCEVLEQCGVEEGAQGTPHVVA